jgi:sulfhydrogenase subunit beta (sulfur reductase)
MEAKLLQRDKLSQLVDALIKDYEVIAPKDDLSYGQIGSGDQVHLSDDHPTKSLKDFFFPQREVLFEYHSTAEGVELVAPPLPDAPRVIFAARPCDVASFPILDKLFTWDYRDSSYLQQRDRTVIVSLACEKPPKACFCVSVGGSPAGIEGSDVLLTPLSDVYHVQVITERGKALVEQYAEFFEESDEQHDQERARREDEWLGQITKQVDVDRLREALAFDNPVWETLTQQCVDCGVCTFLCPTCHCFDIQDEGDPDGGSRVRLWDACALQDFTKMPVHQPRPTHFRRYRQRLMHKFKYYPENFDSVLCVGCGRCIQYCPAGVDITKALEEAVE